MNEFSASYHSLTLNDIAVIKRALSVYSAFHRAGFQHTNSDADNTNIDDVSKKIDRLFEEGYFNYWLHKNKMVEKKI